MNTDKSMTSVIVGILVVLLILSLISWSFRAITGERFTPNTELKYFRTGTPIAAAPSAEAEAEEMFNAARSLRVNPEQMAALRNKANARLQQAIHMGQNPELFSADDLRHLTAEQTAALRKRFNNTRFGRGQELFNPNDLARITAEQRLALKKRFNNARLGRGQEFFDSDLVNQQDIDMTIDMEMQEDQAQIMPANMQNGPLLDATVATIALTDGPGFDIGETDANFNGSLTGVPSSYYFLDDGANGQLSVTNNLCSKSCCADQYPTPFLLPADPAVCAAKKAGDLVSSNYYCNNTFQDAGCLCMTRQQGANLLSRGGNGSQWY